MADFSRDLGYLDKFLASLRVHAGTLDPSAAARVSTLLDEEEARWRELRSLLGGGGAAVTGAAVTGPAGSPSEAAPAPSAARSRRMKLQLTVGSLLRRDPAR